MKTKRFKLAGTAISQPAIDRMQGLWESYLLDEMQSKGFEQTDDAKLIVKPSKGAFEWELYIPGARSGGKQHRR